MNNKKRLSVVIAGVCGIILVGLAILLSYDNSSDAYKTYASYMKEAGLPPLTENAAKEDAAVICKHFSKSDSRPYGYLDKTEVMAIVLGYCPRHVDVATWSV